MVILKTLVTGGSKGIGKEIAFQMARTGSQVGILDVDGVAGKAVEDEAREKNLQIHFFYLDVSSVDKINNWFVNNFEIVEHLENLINNAGVIQTKNIFDITSDDWDFIINVNLRSAFFMTQACAKIMSKKNKGSIVNISSVSGRSGRPLQAHYSVAKAGLISLTKSSALAFADNGIRVNAVCPSIVLTDMWKKIEEERRNIENLKTGEAVSNFLQKIPMKRPGKVEEIASVVEFLCSDKAGYITGQSINVCGGLEMH
jgi:NAD(P)-dependent dehydrogenase (short-subunit alcohol dehydrogenase family)